MDGLKLNIDLWMERKYYWWYVPLLVWYSYLLVQYAWDVEYQSWLDPVNLLIHEAGHLVFLPFGEFMHFAGGTILQLMIPVLFVFYFWWRKDLMAVTFPLVWLATSCFHVATYAADAREQALPLLIEGSLHDWYWMLSRAGLLQWDDVIGLLFRVAGFGLLAGVLLWSLGLIWILFVSSYRKF